MDVEARKTRMAAPVRFSRWFGKYNLRCPLLSSPCRSLLLRDLLHHPEEEIRRRLFDSEPLELGRHLPAVIGRMIDNVAQHRPRRQGRGSAAAAQRDDGVEPLRPQRRLKLLEATIGTLQ